LRHSNLDLAEFFPYLINRVGATMVERFGREALRGTHLTIGTWRILAVVASRDGIRQVDLADLTSIEVSTVSRLVTRLVQLRLVSRSRSNTSSREVVVRLTRNGQTLARDLVPVALALEAGATRGLPKKDLATVKRVLRRMHENLR
jgi:DNA-binding MarR family transcriptional regulator